MNKTKEDEFLRAPQQYEHEIATLRASRVQRLTAPNSWLSLLGKHWLSPGASTVGSDPACTIVLPKDRAKPQLGTFVLEAGRVHFEPSNGAQVRLRDGQSGAERALSSAVELRSDAAGTPDRVLFGSLSLEIMERGGAFAVRTRDTESPLRVNFPGIPYYPIDPSWRVVARIEPYTPHKPIELAYETGTTEEMFSPGAAVFEHDGTTYRVDPVLDGPRPRLFLLFWDLTCRDQSYGAGRFLYAPLPEGDRVVLDFNQAFNPPCAFTPHAACPLPPAQNRLSVRVEAGEKKPADQAQM